LSKKTSQIFASFFTVILLLILVLSYEKFNTPLLSFSQQKKTFNDIGLEISFKYPLDYKARETKAGQVTYIDIYPSYLDDKFEPKFIEIIAMPSESNAPLGQVVLDAYPDLTKRDLLKLTKKGADGVQVIEKSNVNETSVLSYFRYNKKLYLIKFNKSYYDSKNPFVLVNNSSFETAYLSILNSIVFTKSQ